MENTEGSFGYKGLHMDLRSALRAPETDRLRVRGGKSEARSATRGTDDSVFGVGEFRCTSCLG